MARPRDDFDWNLVESLVMMEASEAFIAERLIIKQNEDLPKHEQTQVNRKSIDAKIRFMQRRIQERYKCSFVEFRQQKKEDKKAQLRSMQWKAAQKGSAAMLIWLGKQYLGQSDKVEQKNETHITVE